MVNKSGVIDEIIYNTVFFKKIKTHSDVSVKLVIMETEKQQRNSICMGRLHESNA